jgi:hypothetical protein
MKHEQLRDIIDKIKAVKVAIVGDFCLDCYWLIDESRSEMSIETSRMSRPGSVNYSQLHKEYLFHRSD